MGLSQMLWIAGGIFVLGLFLGTNLGTLVMCALSMVEAQQVDTRIRIIGGEDEGEDGQEPD